MSTWEYQVSYALMCWAGEGLMYNVSELEIGELGSNTNQVRYIHSRKNKPWENYGSNFSPLTMG